MADRWAVAAPATEDWNDITSWSATDGGLPGASIPVDTDNVFLKNLTGSLYINGSGTCANFDCTGCVGTFAATGSSFTVTGDTFKLAAGMTLDNGSATTLTGANAAGDITITRAGKTALGGYTFNGAGKVFKLADALNIGSSPVILTAGELNSQGFDITCGSISTSNANVRTLTLTGSVLTQSSSFSIANTTNLTWAAPAEISVPLTTTATGTLCNFSSSVPILTIRLNSAGIGGAIGNNATGALGGLDIGELRFTGTPTTSTLAALIALSSNCIIDKFTAPEGTEFISSVRGTQRTVTTGTNEISFDGCMIRDIAISGGPAYATNSIDLGNNSGITFSNFGPATHEIAGLTLDDVTHASIEATVYAFKVVGGEPVFVSSTTSDSGTGEYTLGTPDNDAGAYIIVSGDADEQWDAMGGITPTAP